jgi:drug/metabolite transporter (DMT)-like permease
MTKVLSILLVALVFEAIGVVFLSRGLKEIGEVREVNLGEILGLVRRGAGNPSVMTGIAMEAIFFGALLIPAFATDVSLIWPLTSLGFVITALAARWILREEVSWLRWGGVSLIVLGACLVSYSELVKTKRLEGPSQPPAQADDSP